MSCDLPTNWRDCAPPEAVALAREIEAELIERFGFVLSGGALERVLGFTSTAALRKAFELERLPVPVFRMPHRKGRFVLSKDLALWLAIQSRTGSDEPCEGAEEDGPEAMEPPKETPM